MIKYIINVATFKCFVLDLHYNQQLKNTTMKKSIANAGAKIILDMVASKEPLRYIIARAEGFGFCN